MTEKNNHIADQLPKDWKWVKLGEVCNTTSGGTPSRRETKYYSGNIPWVKSGELDKGIITDTEEKITEEAIKSSSAKVFPKGTLLIALYGATIGKLAFLGVDAATNQAICGIYQNEKIDSNFLYNYLFYKKQKLVNQGIGGAQPNISQTILKGLDIPLPPKPTQQAIVSKIEELFSEIENGIKSLFTAHQQLKTYRQSVLKWAFEGRLTERKEKWKNVRLGDVANAIDPQPSHRTPPVVDYGVPFVSIKDFDSELDKIHFTYARRVSQNVLNEQLERYKLEIGDFVIGKIGTIGKPVRIVLPQNYCLSANIVLIQPRKISTTYLYYFFQSNLIEKAFTAGMKATTQAAFGIQKVRELRIELPNDEEQKNVVQEIESRLSVADKMEESINQSLQQAEALKQSILKKAFEGKLI
jgi:type I restriction enzyme, S subunit